MSDAGGRPLSAGDVTLTSQPGSGRPEGKPDLKGLSLHEIEAFVTRLGEPAYRAKQIAAWVFQRDVADFQEMTDLSKELRARLADAAEVCTAEVIDTRRSQKDDTAKVLLEFADGARVESVLLRDDGRLTGCVSTQVGCKFACSFCATGAMGFVRDLTAAEIVEQILALRRLAAPERLRNLVYMGMGEPMDNYDATMASIRIANAGWGLGIGARHITVSTAGHVPGIRRLQDEGLQLQLAVSLNAPEQRLRGELMPIAGRYSLTQLVEAIEQYTARTRRRGTLEYVLLRDINDSEEMADLLAGLASKLGCKVNLICYNENKDSAYSPPTDRAVEQFVERVRRRCPTVVRRISRGADIAAGCGQLCVEHRPRPRTPKQRVR
jgi:23S rRNA (adenine2503-C2)-methyltransferase